MPATLSACGHGAEAAFALGSHAGHVEGVGGHAVADDLGENLCAAGLGELQLFHDEDAGAFADDEAVAVLVEGAAGVFGIVVAGGEGLHGGESADAHGGDGGLGASGDHGVGIAALDDAEGIADGVRAGGAGGRRGLVRALGVVADADVAGGEVDDGAGDEERRDLARAAGQHGRVLALDDVEAADAGADVDADAVGDLRRDLEAGVLHGLVRGGDGEVDEAAHLAGLFFIDEQERVEVLDLGRKADGMAGEIEGLDLSHAALACKQAVPDFGGGFADPADEAEAGDDDATLLHTLLLGRLLVLFDVVDGVLDGLDLLGVFVGDLDVEGFFELHDELDDVEGVGAEVFLEARAGGDFGFIHLKLLDDNLLYFLIYCCHLFLLFTSAIKIGMPVRGTNTAMLKNTERLAECKAKRAPCNGGYPTGTSYSSSFIVDRGGKQRSNSVAFFEVDQVGGGRCRV